MRFNPKCGWFAAFTAVFAVFAAFVFWGTWSPSTVPVMPDCPTSYSSHWFVDAFHGWLESGKFAPAEALNWIGSPAIWTEFQYAFAVYMSGLALAWFLLGRGLKPLAAYGAGLFLGFSGYWLTLFSAGHLGWFQWMTYGVFAFGLIDRALEVGRFRSWLLLGAVLAWGSMRQADLWLLFTVFSAAYFVFRLVVTFHGLPAETRRLWLVSRSKGAVCAMLSLLVIGLAGFRSAFVNDLAGRDKQIAEGETLGSAAGADESEKRWVFVTNWSMPPEATKEFFLSRCEGDTSCPLTLAIGQKAGTGVRPYTGRLGRPLGAPSGNYRQHSLYVGFLTCLLALVGAVAGCRRRSSTVVFLTAAAFVFWLFSLGRFCEPVYRCVFALPFGDYLRAPVKWHHLTEFCLVALAGFGLDALLGLTGRLAPARVVTAVFGVIVLVGVFDLASNARLYCAPHRVNTDLQFADARILQDPRGLAQLQQMKGRVVGRIMSAALVELPNNRANDAPSKRPETNGTVLLLAILSLVGTLSVGTFAVVSKLREEKCS